MGPMHMQLHRGEIVLDFLGNGRNKERKKKRKMHETYSRQQMMLTVEFRSKQTLIVKR
jgi:uncharacterized protein Veg